MSSGLPLASGIENVPHMVAFIKAFEKTLANIDLSKVLVTMPDFCPPEALPFLAQDYDVLGYKGFALCDTDDERRALIKAAPGIKRRAGTADSIEQAIIAVGYQNAIVTERTGIKYNGVYKFDGSKKYGGTKWFNFNVEVFYTGDEPTDLQKDLVTKLINIYKSVRSVLLELKFTKI
jgi:P2-related tail formation protein